MAACKLFSKYSWNVSYAQLTPGAENALMSKTDPSLCELLDNVREGDPPQALVNGTNSVLQFRMPKISRMQGEMTNSRTRVWKEQVSQEYLASESKDVLKKRWDVLKEHKSQLGGVVPAKVNIKITVTYYNQSPLQ